MDIQTILKCSGPRRTQTRIFWVSGLQKVVYFSSGGRSLIRGTWKWWNTSQTLYLENVQENKYENCNISSINEYVKIDVICLPRMVSGLVPGSIAIAETLKFWRSATWSAISDFKGDTTIETCLIVQFNWNVMMINNNMNGMCV